MSTLVLFKLNGNDEEILGCKTNNAAGVSKIQSKVTELIEADKLVLDASLGLQPGYTSSIIYDNNNMNACIKVSMDSTHTVNGFTVTKKSVNLYHFYVTREITEIL